MKFHAVVLAAQRTGIVNELAEDAGVSHKCIMPLVGKPLIVYVLEALEDCPEVDRVTISIDDPSALDGVDMVQELVKSGKVNVVKSADDLFGSITSALESSDNPYPAIITTADNVLMSPDMVAYFTKEVLASGRDVALSMVKKEVLTAKYPAGQKRFHRFADGEWSNSNLYAIMNKNAVKAAEAFKTGGQFAKKPARVLKAFGLINAIAYKYAWFKRDRAIDRIGSRFGTTIKAVDLPFPEAPIDVDNFRSKEIAGGILQARLDEEAAQ